MADVTSKTTLLAVICCVASIISTRTNHRITPETTIVIAR
jgi:hypothetical protein